MRLKLKSVVAGAATILAGLAAATSAMGAVPTPLGAMPTGSVTVHHTHGGGLAVALNALGLTPGSAHEVNLSTDQCDAIATGSGMHAVEADGSGRLQARFQVSKRRSRGAASVSLLLGTPGSMSGGVSPHKVIACANIPRHLEGSTQLALKPGLGWGSHLGGLYGHL